MQDLYSNLKPAIGVKPVAAGTTGTGQVGKVVDRRGYDGVLFLIAIGEITSSVATFTPTVKEGDVTGAMTSVANADLIGTEAGAAVGAGARASGTTKNVVKKIGYRGNKRYVSCSVVNTATAGTPISVIALLGAPAIAPVAT